MTNPAQIAATSVHDLAHAKGVPTAAREAMLLMQERIAELEAENAKLSETVRKVQASARTLTAAQKEIYDGYVNATRVKHEAANTLDSEREANALLTSQVEAYEARITRQDAVIAGLVDLLAKATADIAAALIITDKQDVVAAWCEKYVDAINKHDAEAAALAKAKESRDV